MVDQIVTYMGASFPFFSGSSALQLRHIMTLTIFGEETLFAKSFLT